MYLYRDTLIADLSLVTFANPPSRSQMKSKGIKPISLDWKAGELPEGTEMFAIGLGGTQAVQYPYMPSTLRNATMFKLSSRKCVKIFSNDANEKRSICLRGEGRSTVCGGDSGGPIVSYKRVGAEWKLFLMGIISAAEPSEDDLSCTPGARILCVQVDKFKGWIERRVGAYKRW